MLNTVKKAVGTKIVSFMLMGSMLPMTTACEDHEIAVGAAIIAAGAAISSVHHRDHRRHRRDDYRRSRRHYDRHHDHHHRHERRRHRHRHFQAFFVADHSQENTQYKSLKDTSTSLVEEVTLQDYMKAYKLNKEGAKTLKEAVEQADQGYLGALEDLGLNATDIQDLHTAYRVKDERSVKQLARKLDQKVVHTKSMLHKMAMYARDLRLEACEADAQHFDSICN